MDINLMKEIFGSMPIDHLPTAEIIKQQKLNRDIIIVVGVISLAVGIGLGIHYATKLHEAKMERSSSFRYSDKNVDQYIAKMNDENYGKTKNAAGNL